MFLKLQKTMPGMLHPRLIIIMSHLAKNRAGKCTGIIPSRYILKLIVTGVPSRRVAMSNPTSSYSLSI